MAESNKGIINYGRIGGNASVRNQEIVHGDRKSVEASGSTVALNGQASTVGDSAADDPAARLEQLLAELNAILARLPPANREAGEALQRQADTVIAEARKGKPNGILLKSASSMLEQIGNALGEVAPAVPALVRGVASAAAAIAGLF